MCLLVAFLFVAFVIVLFEMLPVLARFKIVDDIEAVILAITGGDLEMLLLAHMLSQHLSAGENLFAVQAL